MRTLSLQAETNFGGGNPHLDIPQLLSMYKADKLPEDFQDLVETKWF